MKRSAQVALALAIAVVFNVLGLVLLTMLSTGAPEAEDAPELERVEAPEIREIPRPTPKTRPDRPRPEQSQSSRAQTRSSVAPSQLPRLSSLTTPSSVPVSMQPALERSLDGFFSDLSRQPGPGPVGDPGLFEGRQGEEEVRDAAEVEQPPSVRQRVAPRYPRQAERDGVTGHVVLRGLIEKDGRVSRVEVVDASPVGVFEEAARAAFARWQFEPARDMGRTVRVWVRKRLEFRLR